MTKTRILVVEDEVAAAKNTERKLTPLGYYVCAQAITGEDAVRQVAQTQPDLVLIDINLKGDTDGVEAAEQIHTRFNVPVVYLTAHADDATLRRAKATAPFGYVPKPAEAQDLQVAIEMALSRHGTERKLQESEEHLRAIADCVYDWEYWIGPDGDLLYVSPSCERVTGYSPAEFQEDPGLLEAIVHTDDHAQVAKHLREEMEVNRVFTMEFRITARDGEERWIGHVCRPVYDANGHWMGQRASNRDITEQRATAEGLRRREQDLELINRASRAFTSTLDLDRVLATVLEEVRRGLDVTACSVWLVDRETGELVCRQATDPRGEIVRGWRLAPGQGIAGWVAQNGQSVNVPDARLDERHFTGVDRKTMLDTRSILSVPLQVKDTVIGVAQAVDSEPNRFTSSDMELVESLATAAAVAIENARLYQETDRLRVFNQNIVQSVEEGITFEDVMGNITFVNPKMASLVGCPADEFTGRHWKDILTPEEAEKVEQRTAREPQDIARRYETALLTEKGQQVPVIVSACPVFENGHFSGMLSAFTDITDLKLTEKELKQRYHELEILNRASQALIFTLDMDEMITVVLEEVRRELDALACSAWLIDTQTGDLVCRQSTGPMREVLIEWRLAPGQGIAGWVAGTGSQLIVPDTRLDTRHYKEIDRKTGTECRSILSVPLIAKERVIGVIEAVSTEVNHFSESDLTLVALLSPTTAVAIENARLHRQVAEAASLEERQRLARDLHDSVSQSLYSLTLQAEGYRRLVTTGSGANVEDWFADLGETAHQALKGMRLLLYELGPSTLKPESLVTALRHRLDAVEGRVGVKTSLEVDENINLPPWVEEDLFRIAQEALNNALKHSGATSVTVCLRGEPGRVELEVVDDGTGFDLTTVENKGGMGLASMRERANRLGGSLVIQSAPDEGTRVKLSIET